MSWSLNTTVASIFIVRVEYNRVYLSYESFIWRDMWLNSDLRVRCWTSHRDFITFNLIRRRIQTLLDIMITLREGNCLILVVSWLTHTFALCVNITLRCRIPHTVSISTCNCFLRHQLVNRLRLIKSGVVEYNSLIEMEFGILSRSCRVKVLLLKLAQARCTAYSLRWWYAWLFHHAQGATMCDVSPPWFLLFALKNVAHFGLLS